MLDIAELGDVSPGTVMVIAHEGTANATWRLVVCEHEGGYACQLRRRVLDLGMSPHPSGYVVRIDATGPTRPGIGQALADADPIITGGHLPTRVEQRMRRALDTCAGIGPDAPDPAQAQ